MIVTSPPHFLSSSFFQLSPFHNKIFVPSHSLISESVCAVRMSTYVCVCVFVGEKEGEISSAHLGHRGGPVVSKVSSEMKCLRFHSLHAFLFLPTSLICSDTQISET